MIEHAPILLDSQNTTEYARAYIKRRYDDLPALEEEISVACAGKSRVLIPGVVTTVMIVIIVAP